MLGHRNREFYFIMMCHGDTISQSLSAFFDRVDFTFFLIYVLMSNMV